MNNKAEGRISSFVITIVLCIGVLMLFSSLVLKTTTEYDSERIEEFDSYSNVWSGVDNNTQSLIDSQNAIDENNQTSGFLDAVKDKFENTWEDSILRKAWSTISIFPKFLKSTKELFSVALLESGLNIPTYAVWLVFSLIGLTFAFLVLKAIWERKT